MSTSTSVCIAAMGDLHLNLTHNKVREQSQTLYEALREARFTRFEEAVTCVTSLGAQAILISGDVFDSHDPTFKDLQRTAEILNSSPVHVVVISGNHDFAPSPNGGLWQRFSDLLQSHVIVSTKPDIIDLSRANLPIRVHTAPCQSKRSKNHLLGTMPNFTNSEDHLEVFLGHGSLDGVSCDVQGNYYPMTHAELSILNCDIAILGHCHNPYTGHLTAGRRVYYPGTHEPDRFGCNHGGHALLLNVEKRDGQVSIRKEEFVKTGKYRFVMKEFDINSAGCLERIVRDLKVQADISPNSLLKLVLNGSLPASDMPGIRAMMEQLEALVPYVECDMSQVNPTLGRDDVQETFPTGSLSHQTMMELFEFSDNPSRVAPRLPEPLRAQALSVVSHSVAFMGEFLRKAQRS